MDEQDKCVIPTFEITPFCQECGMGFRVEDRVMWIQQLEGFFTFHHDACISDAARDVSQCNALHKDNLKIIIYDARPR